MHLRKLPSGNYRVIVKVNGRQRTATRLTRDLARSAGAELILELGGKPNRENATVGELLAGHLADVEHEWSPTTYADVASISARLPEPFRERPVREVTPAIIAGLYRQLTRDGWSPHRLRRVRMLLSGAWRKAISYEWATTNPVRDVPLPAIDQPDVAPPDDTTLRAIIAELTGAVLLFVRLAACTGARRGELVALRWADVDLDGAEVVIRHSLVQVPKSAPIERQTKTGAKGFRKLPLDLPAVAALRRHRAEQLERALRSGLPAPTWIFSHDAGMSPWRPDYVSREFARARARVGRRCAGCDELLATVDECIEHEQSEHTIERDRGVVDRVRLHDVRHYVAVTMLQDGESAADVAGQLGHASVATTLSTYWRHMPGRGRDAAERRAERLAGEISTPY